mmetsp:Transcript_27556/g.34209  ORF Transcript_27556/g.34209 Transcript_27556/m.34209 type:complete len:163 (+) Transcript_27556:1415-1903(+)
MEYFSCLPAVTYQHARYSDWIQPFLQSMLNKQQSSASYNYGYGGYGMLSRNDIVKIISKFDLYQAFVQKKDGFEEAKDATESAGRKILNTTPPAFIICRCTDENYLNVIDSGDVSLSLSYLKASYVWSKPTGYTNAAISDAFLRKGAPKAIVSVLDTSRADG